MFYRGVCFFIAFFLSAGIAFGWVYEHEEIIRLDAKEKKILIRSIEGESSIVVEALARTREQAFEFMEYLQKRRDRFEAVAYQNGTDEELGHGFTLVVQPVPPDDGADRSRAAYRAVVKALKEHAHGGSNARFPGWYDAKINRYPRGRYRVYSWMESNGIRRRYVAKVEYREGWHMEDFKWLD